MATRQERVADAYREGRTAWPDVALDLLAFTARTAALTDDNLAAHGTDIFLAVGCLTNDASALRHFDEELSRVVPAARRYCADADEVNELLQRVRIHLLVPSDDAPARIAVYDGRASLAAWLSVVTTRMALYLARGKRNAIEIPSEWFDVVSNLPTGQPELELVRTRYAEVFNQAWRAAARELTPRQRALLGLCFVECASIDTIAATYAVHRVTVWRWLEQAKQQLLAGTRAQLLRTLPDNAPGTESLLDLVHSQLDLGLSEFRVG